MARNHWRGVKLATGGAKVAVTSGYFDACFSLDETGRWTSPIESIWSPEAGSVQRRVHRAQRARASGVVENNQRQDPC